ncbi:mycofactocin precursor [Blastococcus sp. CT_GayMR19]|nr:mycofactocin precursor [Blastococcus sp. CT_GayMR19]
MALPDQPGGGTMPEPRTQLPTTDADVLAGETPVPDEEVLTSELLVEEVSIDGMCGVY